jgi:hypothetical protein
MRFVGDKPLILSLAAYLAGLVIVFVGVPLAMLKALSTVEQPSWLAREHGKPAVAAERSTHEIPVVLKPYVAPTPQATWRPSVAQSYTARAKPDARANTADVSKKKIAKPDKRRSKSLAKKRPNAMDAYASGQVWRPY